jgi:hypothetical protein
MRYTICSECRSLFAYRKSTCPECHVRHSRETVQRVKLCPHDGTPMPVNRSFCPACGWDMRRLSIPGWAWLVLLIAVSLMNTLFLANLREYISTTFHPASCIIHSASINANSNKDIITYSIVWNYAVIGKNGQQVYSGQDDMRLKGDYGSQAEAKQVVLHYQAEGMSPCWYSSTALFTKARLVPPDESVAISLMPIWLFAPLVLFSLIGACIIWIIWSWRLFKYGRNVVGTVIEREMQQSRYGVTTHCAVAFKTQTNPALNFHKHTRMDLRKRQRVDVFYDPLYPEQTARIGSNLTLREMRLHVFSGSLAILLLLGMLGGLVLTAFLSG